MLLPAIVVQPTTHLSCVTRYSQQTNTFSKVKVRLHGFRVQRTMNWKRKCYYLEMATEPPMDPPTSKLIRPYRLAWRGSNKAVTLSLNQHWSGSLTGTFQVCHANGVEGSPLDLAPYVFVCEFLHVSIRGNSFSLRFSTLSKLFH